MKITPLSSHFPLRALRSRNQRRLSNWYEKLLKVELARSLKETGHNISLPQPSPTYAPSQPPPFTRPNRRFLSSVHDDLEV